MKKVGLFVLFCAVSAIAAAQSLVKASIGLAYVF